MVTIKNPITIVNVGGGQDEPGGDSHITAYDATTGVITGDGFGSTTGTVYLLDRDTHSYVPQPTSSWYNTSITLTNPVDTSAIEGTTSLVVVNNDGIWSTKWLITGGITVTGWAKLYIQNPDTIAIYTVSVGNSTDFNKLYNGTSNGFAKQITIGSDTFYFDEIVGVQFGSSFGLTQINDSFLRFATNLNQPVVFPTGITSIGSNLLSNCYGFNQIVTIPELTSIPNSFLDSCKCFNQPLPIPNTVTSIGSNFLNGCYSFNQPLTIPSGVTSIGAQFLYNCQSFNNNLSLPSTVTGIGNGFLYGCAAFNQSLTIPSGVTSIDNTFLNNCTAFSQPLAIPSGVTSIGNSFLTGCSSFNQPLTIPSGVTSIGTQFLQGCYSFNQPLTIPSGVTGSIGTNFMYNCAAFSNLTVNTTISPTDTNSVATQYNTAKMYVKGVTVKGTGRSTWISALPNRTSSPYRKLIDGGE